MYFKFAKSSSPNTISSRVIPLASLSKVLKCSKMTFLRSPELEDHTSSLILSRCLKSSLVSSLTVAPTRGYVDIGYFALIA